MHLVHVFIHVQPLFREAFIEATRANVAGSNLEPGIVRFDLLQETDDPDRFVLVEIYQSPDDIEKHRATAHYLTWRDTVSEWMMEPRRGVKYDKLAPTDGAW